MKNEIHLLRRSQSLSPFGVGAVIDQQGESFVPTDVTLWKGKGEEIREARLEAYLGVRYFKMAPAAPEKYWQAESSTPGVTCVRFPAWFFCQNCRRMAYHPFAPEAPICGSCHSQTILVPMRFLLACPRGHLMDVDWLKWAHSTSGNRACRSQKLKFLTKPGGSGLEFLEVKCEDCGSSRSLAGIASRDSMKSIGAHCQGTQPWQTHGEGETCDAIPQVLLRGATNLTFAQIESAIEIPPYSSHDAYSNETTRVTSSSLYTAVKTAFTDNPPFLDILLPILASQVEMNVEQVRAIVEQELTGGFVVGETRGIPEDKERGLLEDEFNALNSPVENYLPQERFIKRTVSLEGIPEGDNPAHAKAVKIVLERMGKLVQVTRLREVRALRGFSRLGPIETARENPDEEGSGKFSLYSSDERIGPRLVPADLGKMPANDRWLPAIEVFGEGIFFTLHEERLQKWETTPTVRKRVRPLMARREKAASYLPEPTPRLVLLHTLAHLLIRQLSFDCGYSVASLRERLYVRDPGEGVDFPMAGILIYTAAGDSEGTLGGLVRQGRPDRMMATLLKTIQSGAWCSSDPLCRESQGQGLHALNLAACHACCLLPETSCIISNRLLDRVMLTGCQDGSTPGFFGPLLDHIQASMSTD